MSIMTEFRTPPQQQPAAQGFAPPLPSATPRDAPAKGIATSRCRADERRRWIASRIVAALGAAALISALPTPLRGMMHGLFGGGGVIGPITAAASVVFWSLGLLLIARGLRHGHKLAWALTLSFLSVAVCLHLVRHDDPVETALLCLGAAWLVLGQGAFSVPVSTSAAVRALAMVGGVAALVLSAPSFPLGFGGGVASTALLGFALLVLVGALWALLSPRAAQQLSDLDRRLERGRARQIVNAHGRGTLDYFALRDDKRWFFHAHSVVAYAVRFGVCLVSPDPIGPVDERHEVWTVFTKYARSQGWSVSVLGASAEWIELYQSFGLHPIYLGDEAVVDCSTFSLDGRSMRGLRQACNRIDRAGYTVTFHDPTEIDEATRRELLELAGVSRASAVERGFSMTLSRLFDAEDTGLLLSITRDCEGRARAFIQWMPAPGIQGWSLDVMRYDTGPEVPNGVMDHLIVQTVGHLRARGEIGLGLNFAVIRTLVATEPNTSAGRLGQSLLRALSGRSDIASLFRFNQKFCPEWQPRYVVLDSLDTVACQGLMIAAAEGLSDLPLIGRFMKGVER